MYFICFRKYEELLGDDRQKKQEIVLKEERPGSDKNISGKNGQ